MARRRRGDITSGDLFEALKGAGFDASPIVHTVVGDKPQSEPPPPISETAAEVRDLANAEPVDELRVRRVRNKVAADAAKAPPASLFEVEEGEPGGPLVEPSEATGEADDVDAEVDADPANKTISTALPPGPVTIARHVMQNREERGAVDDLDELANALRDRLSGGKLSGGFSLSFLAKGTPVPLVAISWGRLFDGRPQGQGYESRSVAFARGMREALTLAHTYEDIYDAKGKDAAESWLTTQRHRSEGERVMRAVAEGEIKDPVK